MWKLMERGGEGRGAGALGVVGADADASGRDGRDWRRPARTEDGGLPHTEVDEQRKEKAIEAGGALLGATALHL
jgi:hypothetical protein